ncbi:MAG: DUF2141 domain-containing protein [Flavobacteriales bacterium]|nr:DUF2141 domain-containing protein [Flavobacteriales bacterium]
MKSLSLIIFSLVCFSLRSQNYDIEVSIKNIKNINGYIQIGLYNDPNEFPKVDKEFKRYYFKVSSTNMTYTIKDLSKGKYAIATYHDENSDKKCNRNMIGYPTEDFGFSNNIKVFLTAPSFDQALIELNDNKKLEIYLD